MENEFIEGNTWAAEQISQDLLNLTFLTGVMVEHNKKEKLFQWVDLTQKGGMEVRFFTTVVANKYKPKSPLWTLLDVPLCFLPTSIFFHLLSTLQGFGFHFPKIDLSFCWVSGFHILVIIVHVQFWAYVMYCILFAGLQKYLTTCHWEVNGDW